MNKELIVLVGPKGVGKSVVGSRLAQMLKYKWVDSDVYLHDVLKFERKENYSQEEFNKKKELELEILNFILDKKKVVYSSGEGLVINQTKENLETVEKILSEIDNVILLYKKDFDNETFYEFAKMTVDVDDKTIEEVTSDIVDLIKK